MDNLHVHSTDVQFEDGTTANVVRVHGITDKEIKKAYEESLKKIDQACATAVLTKRDGKKLKRILKAEMRLRRLDKKAEQQ